MFLIKGIFDFPDRQLVDIPELHNILAGILTRATASPDCDVDCPFSIGIMGIVNHGIFGRVALTGPMDSSYIYLG